MAFSFAHISDCHLGSWNNHPELKEMPIVAFERAIDACIADAMDFVLISGDLFDTALPPVDILRRAVTKLRECRDANVRVYAIAGSHDFSPTGRTMLHVLEEAGLIVYVAKYEDVNGRWRLQVCEDPTGARICGMVGKKGALDVESFDLIDRAWLAEIPGFKIFMFHAGVAEFRPPAMQDMPAVRLDQLPPDFDYYATGHIHVRHESRHGKGHLIFPNALFPTEFPELEKYDGGYAVARVADDGNVTVERKKIQLFDVVSLHVSSQDKLPGQVHDELAKQIERMDLRGKALLIKVAGTLASGKPTDIDLRSLIQLAFSRGAMIVKKSLAGVTSREFGEVAPLENLSTSEIERRLVIEHREQLRLPGIVDPTEIVLSLMRVLAEEKGEDETNATYETRVSENAKKVLQL